MVIVDTAGCKQSTRQVIKKIYQEIISFNYFNLKDGPSWPVVNKSLLLKRKSIVNLLGTQVSV